MIKRSFHVANEAIDFVFSNIHVLKKHLLLLFPAFLLLALVNHYAIMYESEFVIVIKILMAYLISCFALTWHRVALRGGDEKPHRLLDFSGKAIMFHMVFFAIYIVMSGIDFAMKKLEANPEFIEQNAILSIAALIAAFAAFYFLMRFMFALPAQSVGVTLSFKDVWRSSRGQVGPLILSGLYVGFLMVMAVMIYSVVMSAINMFVIGGAEISKNMAAGVSFFLSVPIYAAMFLYGAVEVTVLSKLYQAGMQNNA
jgi:hypothetical protein